MNLSFSLISWEFVTKKPAKVSLCPAKYFVALWSTTSAPNLRGFWKYGVKNVLSTTKIQLFFLAILS